MKEPGNLEIVKLPIDSLTPYKRNAKKHTPEQVEQIKESIRLYGNNDPIAVWGKKNMIVEGHGRWLALKELGYTEADCVRLDHLSAQERREYTLVHNQTTMNSGFDIPTLKLELAELPKFDFGKFGFDFSLPGYPESKPEDLEPYRPEPEPQEDGNEPPIDWFENHESGVAIDEDDPEYQEFVEKFKPKKTTDDCYTPDNIYETVAAWVAKEYGVDRSKFVRPFYPGGDYQREKYLKNCVVVDNPPFSILAEIVRFYSGKKIRFFLFAPTLTLFTGRVQGVTYMPLGVSVTYENGARVNTSFITNLDSYQVRTNPELYKLLEAADNENLKEKRKELPKYSYPDEVITAAIVARWSRYGVDFRVKQEDCVRIDALDAMKETGKSIFGDGYLLSETMALERAAAETMALERAAAETMALERAAARFSDRQTAIKDKFERNSQGALCWKLSDRERAIVKSLGGKEKGAADVSNL